MNLLLPFGCCNTQTTPKHVLELQGLYTVGFPALQQFYRLMSFLPSSLFGIPLGLLKLYYCFCNIRFSCMYFKAVCAHIPVIFNHSLQWSFQSCPLSSASLFISIKIVDSGYLLWSNHSNHPTINYLIRHNRLVKGLIFKIL